MSQMKKTLQHRHRVTEPVTKGKAEPHPWAVYAPAADVYMHPAEERVSAIEMVENHMDKVEKCWFYEELNKTVLSLFNETNKIVPKFFCHITKKLRENKNVGRMAEKRARQHLGLEVR